MGDTSKRYVIPKGADEPALILMLKDSLEKFQRCSFQETLALQYTFGDIFSPEFDGTLTLVAAASSIDRQVIKKGSAEASDVRTISFQSLSYIAEERMVIVYRRVGKRENPARFAILSTTTMIYKMFEIPDLIKCLEHPPKRLKLSARAVAVEIYDMAEHLARKQRR